MGGGIFFYLIPVHGGEFLKRNLYLQDSSQPGL